MSNTYLDKAIEAFPNSGTAYRFLTSFSSFASRFENDH